MLFTHLGTLLGVAGASNPYKITASAVSINQAQSVTFTTAFPPSFADGTYYWSTTGTSVASDFTDYSLTGSFTITSGVGTITRTTTKGLNTSSNSSFNIKILSGSVTGTRITTSPQITIVSLGVLSGMSASVNTSIKEMQAGSAVTYTPVSVSGNTGSVSYRVSPSLPAGLSINSSTGVISGTPTSESLNGSYNIFAVDSTNFATLSSITISVIVPGQIEYTTAGTYSWTCPTGVYSVSVVSVGGGGGGYSDSSNPGIGSNYYSATGSGGGGLGYKNNISVTPGQTYTAVVGAAGTYNSGATRGTNGGDSYFISTATVKGGGGVGAWAGAYLGTDVAGGTYTGDGGGNGGIGGYAKDFSYSLGGGGGGAGGYSGNGGAGGNETTGAGGNGAGGGGGGGHHSPYPGTRAYGGTGGGVGLQGQGSNGTGGAGGSSSAPWIGDAGTPGSGGSSALYGGGAGGNTSTNGKGAVRIIWPGSYRQFPSTMTVDYVALSLSTATATNTLYTSASAITPFTPISLTTSTGTTLSISPSLPSGLTMSTSTGQISGTITTRSDSATYTVTATDVFGFSASTTYTLEVVAQGQQAYTTPGTYTWVAPAGVTSVSVVCVGGGGAGGASTAGNGGGGGGALAYGNDIAVTPGASYTVFVGAGGNASIGPSGALSYFDSSAVLAADGGFGGGNGAGTGYNGGGGGAGGYSGAGGIGGSISSGTAGGAGGTPSGSALSGGGAGGAGGKGAGINGYQTPGNGAGGGGGGGYRSTSSGGGGGVGILGTTGVSGAAAAQGGNSGGGSGGTNGLSTGPGGTYGGGGAYNSGSKNGGGGAVRIIWPGNVRQFPNTRTTDA